MRRKIAWLLVSGLMVLSLILASCAPKATEEKKEVAEEKRVAEEQKRVVTEKKEVVAKAELPQYGGVLTLVRPDDPEFWDELTPRGQAALRQLTGIVTEDTVQYSQTD